MSAIWAMAIKDLRLLSRDRVDLFFTFLFPVVFGLFFGYIFSGGGGSGKMSVGLVLEDTSPAARAFANDVRAAPEFKVEEFSSRELAFARVRTGAIVAAVVVPPGFGGAEGGIGPGLFQGKPITIEGAVDPSRRAEAGLIAGKLTELGFRQFTRTFQNPDQFRPFMNSAREQVRSSKDLNAADRLVFDTFLGALDGMVSRNARAQAQSQAQPPIENQKNDAPAAGGGAGSGDGFAPIRVQLTDVTVKRDGPPNAFAVSFPQACVWGLMGAVTAFATSLVSERTRGTLMRLAASPLARWHILAGKGLACFITAIVVQLAMLGVAVGFFGVRPQNPALLALVVVVASFGFVGLMMLIATLSKSEGGAGGLGRALLLILAMIGGGSIPLFFMPPFMQNVSAVSPFRWAIQGLDVAIWRGGEFSSAALPLAILTAMGLVGFIVGGVLFARRASA
ncbi:MAG: ABC transporter permease [Planctomycetota bacterium]|nr:ABC transporter permease [Planctomycetota bacterium]